MKKLLIGTVVALLATVNFSAGAQELETIGADTTDVVTLSLQDALKIALSENVSVKVADKEIQRTRYARQGTYASLFPNISASGSFQRTIKKQVMYMDFAGMPGGEGFEVGRWNTWSGGVSASMPVVNPQLWESIKISGVGVELAVEKARASRLDAVTQTKKAYYSAILAKEVRDVYKQVYDNALANFRKVEHKYNVNKASEMEYLRAKTTLSNAIPDVYNAEANIYLALWQLKAVIGMDLDTDVDITGTLEEYGYMVSAGSDYEDVDQSLSGNSTLKQLSLQAEQLYRSIRLQKFAYIPTLALSFSYTYSAMANDFNFKEYRWTPYSFVGVSLNIPIFSGGKRLSDVRQARNQYEQLGMTISDTERKLKISMRNYLLTMDTAVKSYEAAYNASETADKSYEIVSKSYEVGRSTLTDLNDAQLAVIQARLAKLQSVYQYISTKADMEQLLGVDYME